MQRKREWKGRSGDGHVMEGSSGRFGEGQAGERGGALHNPYWDKLPSCNAQAPTHNGDLKYGPRTVQYVLSFAGIIHFVVRDSILSGLGLGLGLGLDKSRVGVGVGSWISAIMFMFIFIFIFMLMFEYNEERGKKDTGWYCRDTVYGAREAREDD